MKAACISETLVSYSTTRHHNTRWKQHASLKR